MRLSDPSGSVRKNGYPLLIQLLSGDSPAAARHEPAEVYTSHLVMAATLDLKKYPLSQA
jgi:hypothetical protein